jgi:hypothetical protein
MNVNIGENAWKRFYRVAEEMGWELRLSVGSIVNLWHESQDKIRLSGSAKEICKWSRVSDPGQYEKYIDALTEADLIKPLCEESTPWTENEYEILGNDTEVASLVKLKERSKKGGEATKRKWEAENKKKEDLDKATSLPEAMPQAELNFKLGQPQEDDKRACTRHNSIHCNSMQFNSIQSNAIQEKQETPANAKITQVELLIAEELEKTKDAGKEGLGKRTQEFIAYYVDLYRERYGRDAQPPIGGKGAGIAKRIVKAEGLPRAKELVETYLATEKGYYLNRSHDLVAFESDLTTVALKLDTGRTVNATEARQADKRSHYQSQLERIERGEL